MSKGYALIAEGLMTMAKGYELLAGTGRVEEVPKKDVPPVREQAQNNAAQAKETAPEPKKEDTLNQKEAPKVTVVMVRAVIREKIKAGKMEACQEALHSYGVDRLSDVPEDKLSELLSKVEVL